MLQLGRMALFLLVGLSVVYISLYFYLVSGARMRLEHAWVLAGRPGDRDDWVQDRLPQTSRRIRLWLFLCVYVLPITALSVFVYLTN